MVRAHRGNATRTLSGLAPIRPEAASDENRSAPWMKDSNYFATKWTTSDSNDSSITCTIDFDYVMPNGSLLQYSKLAATVREYAFFVRDPRFFRIDDAETHASTVHCLMTFTHALALEGISTFNTVNRAVLKPFLKRVIYGADGLLKASERIEKWITQHEKLSCEELRKLLPLARNGRNWRLQAIEFLRSLGLPPIASQFVRCVYFLDKLRIMAKLDARPETLPDKPPKMEAVNVNTIQRYLLAIESLFYMRNVIDAECIKERPFDVVVQDFAKRNGKRSKPTPLPPPHIALHLMRHAMVWVDNYAEGLMKMLTDVRAFEANKRATRWDAVAADQDALCAKYPQDGPAGAPWPLSGWFRSRQGIPGISPHEAITFLLTACMIVIATFSARRLDELSGLEAGEIRRDSTGAWWLRSYIQKTFKGKEWLPTTAVVSKAFAILTKLSAEARKAAGNKRISQWSSPFTSRDYVSIAVWNEKNINLFSAHVGTPMHAGADGILRPWKWTSHQFRRFFSVLYFYRYRGATIDDLAFFLRHLDLEMTRKYLIVTKEQLKAFKEAEGQYLHTMADDILSGRSDKVGAGRELRARFHLYFQRGLRVSSPGDVDAEDFLVRQMKLRRWVVRPRPWGDCTCPNNGAGTKAAMCRAGGCPPGEIGPNFANSSPVICAGCCHVNDNGRLLEQVKMEELGYRELASSDVFQGSMLRGMAESKVVLFARYEGGLQ